MSESVDAALPRETELHRYLDRALLVLEWGAITLLLALTLAQPSTGRMGLPTSSLVLAFGAYLLVVDVLRARTRLLHSFRFKYILGVPVSGIIYAFGGEPGGPLFVLFFLAVVCATCTLTLRGSLIYIATVILLTVLTDPTLPGWSPAEGDVRDLGARVVLLALFGASTAVLTRRLTMEYEAAREARGESERLAELDRLRMVFVSSVSHDLRTPLTAARAGLGLLETSTGGRLQPDERELLGNARRNTERLGALVDDLLAYNQLEAGTLRLDREPLDLRAAVADAMSSIHPLMRVKGQVLEVELPQPLPVVGDPRRLEQAVVDVLANAYRHTPGDTRVRVSGRIAGREVILSVSDDGPGIPPGDLGRVFERFHRAGTDEGGSGLGLTIARGIVELHGGRIWAESEPGRGATFNIALPLREDGETS